MSIAVRPEFDQPFTTASSLRRVQESLAQLSRTEALWQVVLDTPAEACAACGMDRAMLTHVRDGQIAFASVSTEHDPQLAAAFAKTGRSMRVALVDCPAELEVVTTQRPLVVSDLESANHEVAELARTAGYVVAPIVQGGQTIGLLHADRLFSGEEITEFDRNLLWTFATGVGWAMRQAVAIERHAPAAVQAPAVEEGLAELVREWAAAPGGWAHESRGPDAQLDEAIVSLTARERDVLELMAGGASNAAIGAKLIISVPTVKSHVRSVLRKLGAANRTEAVARFHASTAARR